MTRKLRKRQVEKLIDREFWDGFFTRLGDGLGPSRPLTYTSAPDWYNEVADIAYKAGWEYADSVIAKLGTRKIGMAISREIPGRVYAEAYGAARISA